MEFWWVTFVDGSAGCVAAPNDDEAVRLCFGTGKLVQRCAILPYPAAPFVLPVQASDLTMPLFCFHPEKCQGHRSCPRGRSIAGSACSE